MKNILTLIALIIAAGAAAQSIVPLRGDTIKVHKPGSNAELIVENSTRNKTGAFLRNKWNGRTEFADAIDSAYKVGDTLKLRRGNSILSFMVGSDISGKVNIADSSGSGGYYPWSNPLVFIKSTDTTNKWINSIYRKIGKDSIFFKIGSTEYAIKDSTGGSGTGDGWGIHSVTAGYGLLNTNDSTLTIDFNLRDSLLTLISSKQSTLVSGTNIKTVNGNSLLGSGNLDVVPTGGTTGQVLKKQSGTNYDYDWEDESSGTGNFSEGLTTRNDTAIIDNKRLITYIHQPTTGSSLSGFTAVGTPGYSVSSGAWIFGGNVNGGYTQYIRSNNAVMAEGVYIEAYVHVDSLRSSSNGFQVGWKSINANGYTHDVFAGLITGSGASNTGKVFIYGKTGASTTYSDSARTTNAGDNLYIRFDRDGLAYRIYVLNITQGWKLSLTVQTIPSGSPFVAHNASYPAFVPGGGGYTVTGFKYIIKAPLFTDLLIVGNSITYGQGAPNEWSRWAAMVGNSTNNIIAGGGADGTAEVLATIGEKIAIHPRAVLLMIGGNNILFDGSLTSTAKTEYTTSRDSLVAHSIEVIHCFPTPRTATDERPLKDWIDTTTTFRSDVKVDTWTPLWSGSSYTMNSRYNLDNTHPNPAGHGQIASAVNYTLHYPNSIGFYIARHLYVPNGWARFTDQGTGMDQFNAGGVQIQSSTDSTKVLQMGYYSDGGYIGSYTKNSTYDKLYLSPAGAPRVIIGSAIVGSANLSIRNNVAGTQEALSLSHAGSYSANDQELQVNWYNGGTKVAGIASYLHSSSKFGLRLWTFNGSVFNTTPALSVTGDNTVGVGASSTPTAWLHVPASTTSYASFRVPTGTAPTSPNEGDIWRASNIWKTYNGSATRRFVVTDDNTASNGYIPIGNGTDFTLAPITSTGGSITVTNGSGSINIETATSVTSGTFTSTPTGITNVAASTTSDGQYTKIGSVVTCSFIVTVDPTAVGLTELKLSVPVTSAFTQTYQAAGTATCLGIAGQQGVVNARTADGSFLLSFIATDITSQSWAITVTYTIVSP